MRISDWSSDVCSSDLVVASGDQYLAYFTQGRSNVPLRVSSDWTTWSKPVDVLPVLPPWTRPGRTWAPAVAQRAGDWVLFFTAWHEIGLASCRERVWQSWLVWVDDVAVVTKTNK